MHVISIFILCAFVRTCIGFTFESPCPEVFRYEPEVVSDDGQWHGKIILPSKELSRDDQINVVLNKPVLKFEIFAEKLTTEDNIHFLISNPILKTDATYISFHVTYKKDTQTAPPKLEKITLNDRSICVSKRKKRNTIDEECGKVIKEPTVPFITHSLGTTNIREYPWHAGIFNKTNVGVDYQCGGSLISKQHVITAAHCVLESQHSTRPAYADTIIVFLGLENRRRLSSTTVQDIDVSRIIIHPGFNLTHYHNDLAVITLRSEATITDIVRPICLWSGDVEVKGIVNRLGNVPGWGIDENGAYKNSLKHARLPVVSETECLRSQPEIFGKIYGQNDFCAGFRNKNETSVCNGDSGGGMAFVRYETNVHTIWHLRGIVSIGVQKIETRVCDPRHYVIFTDAAKYLQWIRQQLSAIPLLDDCRVNNDAEMDELKRQKTELTNALNSALLQLESKNRTIQEKDVEIEKRKAENAKLNTDFITTQLALIQLESKDRTIRERDGDIEKIKAENVKLKAEQNSTFFQLDECQTSKNQAIAEKDNEIENRSTELYKLKTELLAAKMNLTRITKKCLKQGRSSKRSQALFAAAKDGKTEEVRRLLRDCEDPNAIGPDNQSPLFTASEFGHTGVALLLIAFGGNVNYVEGRGFSPLTAAGYNGHADIIRLLLAHGARLNHVSKDKQNAVHYAARRGQVAALKVLIAAGGNIHAKNMYGETPLSSASSWGNQDKQDEIVAMLKAAGAKE